MVDSDSALVHIVEARNEVHQAGLAGAGGAHQCNRLARFRHKADMTQYRIFSVIRIAEDNVGKLHAALEFLHDNGILPAPDRRFTFQHLMDTHGGCLCA